MQKYGSTWHSRMPGDFFGRVQDSSQMTASTGPVNKLKGFWIIKDIEYKTSHKQDAFRSKHILLSLICTNWLLKQSDKQGVKGCVICYRLAWQFPGVCDLSTGETWRNTSCFYSVLDGMSSSSHLQPHTMTRHGIGWSFTSWWGRIEPEITHRPALGTMMLIARKMLYVRCVGQCLQSLHVDINLAGKY